MSCLIRKQCTYKDECKLMATATCEGCSEGRCTKHFIEHRRSMREEMSEIISKHDEFQHELNQQTKQPTSHMFIKRIDDWEKESIAKIQQKANELRQELLELATAHLNEVSKKLQDLSEKLKTGQEEDSFLESDLENWKKSLDELKANLASSSIVEIIQHEDNPLVKNLSAFIRDSDLFERTLDSRVQIEENGRLAIHDASNNYIRVRGRNEYTSGRHEVHLHIDHSTNTWLFLGINSKLTDLQNKSENSKTVYGWSSNNYFWSGGNGQQNTSTTIEMKTNDIIKLIFDCDNQKIFMINERTKAKYEITVDINQCAFPWQLQVILFESNCRVRVLPSSC